LIACNVSGQTHLNPNTKENDPRWRMFLSNRLKLVLKHP